jgi:hypothetical protein
VREWKRTISKREYIEWVEYFRQQPFDDFHRFHRPAALVASAMARFEHADIEIPKMLEFLQPKIQVDLSPADLDAAWTTFVSI